MPCPNPFATIAQLETDQSLHASESPAQSGDALSTTFMTKGETTRSEIIRKAAPIFNQRGYAGTSMQDVMQATGLEKGGLYRHFAGKQELAFAAYSYAVGQAFAARLAHAEQMHDAIGKLRAMVAGFVELPSPVAGGCPLMNLGVDADDTNPRLRLLALKSLRTWKAWIIKTVDEGKRAGNVRPHVDPIKIANQIVATLEGGLLISRLEKNPVALHHAAQGLTATLDLIEQRS